MFLSLLLLVSQVDTLPMASISANRVATESYSEVVVKPVSVKEALVQFPDIQLTDFGPSGMVNFSARGLGSAHTLIVYDGVPVRDAQNNQFDLAKFSTESWESISLYNGNKFDLLAPASTYISASSLFLTSKKSSSDAFSKSSDAVSSSVTPRPSIEIHPSLLTSYGSYQTTDNHFTLDGRMGASLLSARLNLKNTAGFRDNDDLFSQSAELNHSLGNWATKAYFYHSMRGTPGSTVYVSDGREEDRDFILQSSYKKMFEKLAYALSGKYTHNYMRYEDSYGLNNYYQNHGYLSASMAYLPFSWMSAGLSADAMLSNLQTDVVSDIFDDSWNVIGQLAFPEVLRLNATTAASLKLSKNGWTLHGSYALNVVDEKDHRWSKAVPSVIASYAGKSYLLYSSYRETLRTPAMNELYYPMYSNPDLKAEYVRQFDLGGKLRIGCFSLDGVLYANRVKDKIVSTAATNYVPKNYDTVDGRGATLSLSHQASWQRLKINSRLSYAYQQVESEGRQLPNVPKHTLSFFASMQYLTWQLSLIDRFNGSRPDAYDSVLSSYNVLDVKIEKQWGPCRLGLAVNNALNADYEVVQYYPMPKRSIMGSLAISF